MRSAFFHWGIHAWAIYAVVGLALASVALDELDYRRDEGTNSWTMVRLRRPAEPAQ